MPKRLSIRETLDLYDYESIEDFCDQSIDDFAFPACCEDECQVEADGHCPHGYPSLPLALGLV